LGTTGGTAPLQRVLSGAWEVLANAWGRRVAGEGLKVGIVWAGSRKFAEDGKRSVAVELLTPIFSVEGVRFFGLQKGEGVNRVISESRMADLSEELNDFADTAAAIGEMDLVITVDTSVAHLAGSMGKAVWVMLPFVPDWRWLLGREESVWYPTMRLFRQRCAGDWGDVVGRVEKALREFVAERQR
jgi:hypothetical protein